MMTMMMAVAVAVEGSGNNFARTAVIEYLLCTWNSPSALSY